MKRLLYVCAGLFLAANVVSAQSQAIKGTLVDNMCFSKSQMSQTDLAKHSRECALMAGCVKSGYALVTADGHVFKLDVKGNAEAVAALKASKQADSLKVTVTGVNNGGTIAVATLMLDQ